jgi:type IV pilus assembly protein PilY1
MKKTVLVIGLVILSMVQSFGSARAAEKEDYCVQPAFITAGVRPNLLLMIDNSASMYDLQYQDTTNLYCANKPTTACAEGSTCSGDASCLASYTSSSSTTTTAKACTIAGDCPSSTAVTTAKSCASDADCNNINNDCNNGLGKCKTVTITIPACNSGYCTNDFITSTTTTYTPIACTTDATCSAITAGDTCNNKCTSTRQCYDNTYNTATTYSGYFDATATYNYSFTSGNFVSGATMPLSCTYSAGTTKYLCVNTTGFGTAETVVNGDTGFVAKGNFLNWLSTSKFDVQKQILTGGKYDGTNLIGETRGCAGRDYIKALPGVDLTFAIRGGTAGGLSQTQNQASEYGQTYIEIYAGTYNADACLAAMDNWMTLTTNPVNLGAFQNDTKDCVGAGNAQYNAVNIWNHILHDCYNGILDRAQGYETNLNALETECKKAYDVGILPASITDLNSGIAICSSALSYVDTSGTSQLGYLGSCYSSGSFNSTCALTQMENYCKLNVSTTPVTDPTSTTLSASSLSVPGFILAQGLMNTQKIGYFPVKVAKSPAPEGLINSDKYKDIIRFGAMTFQNNAAGTECGGTSAIPCVKTCEITSTRICYSSNDCPEKSPEVRELCNDLAKTDGSKIISYVGVGKCSDTTTIHACDVDSDCSSYSPSGQYCVSDVGDHSSGLVKAINDIPATSWTPFAEAFYNAIGYFGRTNAYSATPPASRSDANFNQLPSPNTAVSYISSKNPSQFSCQANNILLITDGMSTADRSASSEGMANLYASQVPNTINGTTSYGISGYDTANSCPAYSGSRSVSDLSWVAKNRDIKTLATTGTASTTTPQAASESITSYVVYTGPQTSGAPGLCDPKTLMTNTAANGGTTLFPASDPTQLYDQIDAAFSSVAARAASGTAASILSNSEGSGANILQAVFYPKKIFDNATYATWIGEMLNLWYYVDPYINNSTIREDTNEDLKLNLISDYVTRFTFDNASDRTMVQRYSDDNGDGSGDTAVGGLIDPDDVKTIWRAGRKLWERDLSVSPRKLFTSLISGGTEISGTGLMTFTYGNNDFSDNSTILQPYLQYPVEEPNTTNNAKAVKLMQWVHGYDFPGEESVIRNRTVKSGNIPAAAVSNVSTNLYVTNPRDKGIGVWKLGDIISSTPRLQSTVRLNTYNLPRPGGYNDKSYESYANSNEYATRGMVYVGANDGMLHAFNLGILSVKSSGYQKASLSGTNLGKEEWSFIPKNFLPYLRYLSDPAYAHQYSVDGRTVIFDASIGDTNTGTCIKSSYWECAKLTNSSVVTTANNLDPAKNTWRTIVIGGMGLGGASRSSCIDDVACVQTPIIDPADASKSLGYSSYFALDVTDPLNPKYLWEFSNNELGFATTGPAIVRVGDPNKNGRWFAVFGNGPFGEIDKNTQQFKGNSDHHLRFFIVDLRTGELVKTITTGIDNGFAGAMLGGAIDADRWDSSTTGNYQDDAIYVGYTKYMSESDDWTDGGVGRILTKESIDPNDATNPWEWSIVKDGIGPVTTSIARLQDKKNRDLWLFFGTGRYFYRDSVNLDDRDSRRALYGIKEPCYNTEGKPGNYLDPACSVALSGSIVDQTSSISTVEGTNGGWRIDLDNSTPPSEGAERVVTDTVALTNGSVFFTTFKPSLDICGYGGNSYLWGVKYNTGGQAAANALQGKALIQLSSGEFKEVDLSTAFTDTGTLNRRMGVPMTGKPPSDAPPIVSNSQNKPVRKILHIKEH